MIGFILLCGSLSVWQENIKDLFKEKAPAPVARESVETSALESQLTKNKDLSSINKLEKQDPELESAINSIINSYPSSQDWSVYVQDLASTRSFSLNSDKSYNAGNLYQLFLLVALESKISSDKWDNWWVANSNLFYCVGAMLKEQGNDNCAKSIGNIIKWEYASHYVQDHGFGHTKISDINSVTTPRDVGSLLLNLKRNKQLSDTTRRIVFDALYVPKTGKDVSGIAKGCEDCRTANLSTVDAGFVHDAGIVTKGKHSYMVVVMSKNGTQKQIAQIVKAIDKELAP